MATKVTISTQKPLNIVLILLVLLGCPFVVSTKKYKHLFKIFKGYKLLRKVVKTLPILVFPVTYKG